MTYDKQAVFMLNTLPIATTQSGRSTSNQLSPFADNSLRFIPTIHPSNSFAVVFRSKNANSDQLWGVFDVKFNTLALDWGRAICSTHLPQHDFCPNWFVSMLFTQVPPEGDRVNSFFFFSDGSNRQSRFDGIRIPKLLDLLLHFRVFGNDQVDSQFPTVFQGLFNLIQSTKLGRRRPF